ncbi:MAG TPA: beta-ketoacyl-[acyl-carrier-protein] synthase family protein [Methylophilus sp.]|uniref:beta-ketoacyl-[acyl-carrier-protein] synthase family protein n=1 Tax=Methylophilus sp. TaxID=29541 RepID=UPI002D1303A8|nr:beta-ketoacyl-[acyl-carrier-protein] synthase family protein [Methylophilus sp.]HSH86798.1 beta-ketoacyl-[acyl-carrier-protein] synthase family protein [Methylophilus sp.]
MKPLLLSHFTVTSCIGKGLQQTLDALLQQRQALKPCDFETVDLPTFIGEVEGVDEVAMPANMQEYDCRNNRLAKLGLEQDGFEQAVNAAISQYGADRIGVFLGTSTSGILETELAFRNRDKTTGKLPENFIYGKTQNTYSVADFTRHYFQLSGPAAVVSSACSSSAKVFSLARRMLEAGLIDAAIVGGVDTLCLTTLYGFNSLNLLSSQACRPYDKDRNGISIGEAAAFALLERTPDAGEAPDTFKSTHAADTVLLLGIGESSDAYHMSSPHPEGLGAKLAMHQALDSAGLKPSDIDYINLHGTATPSNDAAEAKAVMAIFEHENKDVPCSSSKGATGHTLGAAGGVEAVICALALQHGFIPGGLNTQTIDTQLPLNYQLQNRPQTLQRVMSNSFGFGGTNCSLIFGLASAADAETGNQP